MTKILHINTLSTGGAANAAVRLHHGLLLQGLESQFLTLTEGGNIQNHIVFPSYSRYGLNYRKRLKNKLGIQHLEIVKRQRARNALGSKIEYFSSPETDYNLADFIQDKLDVDVINLHWIANFLDYEEFFAKIRIPVIWTLHDENPFSSYWHYSGDHIQTPKALELHNAYVKSKELSLEKFESKIEIVAPSQWLLNESEKSRMFSKLPHHHIPYGVDTSVFKPTFKKSANSKIPTKGDDEPVGLFICQSIANKRKGIQLLRDAILTLADRMSIQFIAIGQVDDDTREQLPANIHFTGSITDEHDLAAWYNFADFTVIPSMQDNLPNTMLESLCCGTPVLGTPAGGIPEIVNQHNFGMVADDFSSESLVDLIEKFSLEIKTFNREEISKQAHQKFSLDVQALAYAKLYRDVLSKQTNDEELSLHSR